MVQKEIEFIAEAAMINNLLLGVMGAMKSLEPVSLSILTIFGKIKNVFIVLSFLYNIFVFMYMKRSYFMYILSKLDFTISND